MIHMVYGKIKNKIKRFNLSLRLTSDSVAFSLVVCKIRQIRCVDDDSVRLSSVTAIAVVYCARWFAAVAPIGRVFLLALL